MQLRVSAKRPASTIRCDGSVAPIRNTRFEPGHRVIEDARHLPSPGASNVEVCSRHKSTSTISPQHNGQRGIVILLVAVVLLFVVGAMAALSIDVATFYTVRSEAQLAADSAALAGARVLANSGLTSTSLIPPAAAEALAISVADQVAQSNIVGGRALIPANGEVVVTFNDAIVTNPRVTVVTKRTDVPTFFARIWGTTAVTIQASATAEAYNPSGAGALPGGVVIPVAPTCVKPIVLPNISPSPSGGPIINTAVCPGAGCGAIADPALVGEDLTATPLGPLCPPGQCKTSALGPGAPTAWHYYPGTTAGATPSFPPPPANSLAACTAGFNAYQESIAGCVPTPIACGATISLEPTHNGLRSDTDNAINCLAHTTSGTAGEGDTVDPASGPLAGLPFQFLAGTNNPLVSAGTVASGGHVLVSDSIVTLPIFDSSVPLTTSVTVVGFVQLLVNSDGSETPPGSGQTKTTVINIAGCGTGVPAVQPILGNGASPVPVRLISP